MIDRLLSRAEVEARVALRRSSLYRLMRENRFPLPIVVGRRAVRWSQAEIEKWIADRPRARGQSDSRAG